MSRPATRIPRSWDPEAHRLYLEEKLEAAVNLALKEAPAKPDRFVQATYYAFMGRDYGAALRFAREYLKRRPGDVQMLNNASACCTKLGLFREAAGYARQVLDMNPESFDACDALAHACGRLGDMAQAVEAGTRSLILKDRAASLKPLLQDRYFPEDRKRFLEQAERKKSVCSFSLFGDSPRYLCGALYNALVAKELYPGWTLRFYVDETVPEDFRDLLRRLGCELLLGDAGAPAGMKLCRRFLVASDPDVGRFVVRDCDAAFSLREAMVVDEWRASGRLFHVIRDWYTHTDLMLAGLWGGIACVLPDMEKLLDDFFASNRILTPNLDQLFLGEYVWPAARQSCLVHDRHFNAFSPARPPMRFFRTRNDHIGSDRHVVDRAWQNAFLAPWMQACPCLRGEQA